MSFDPGPTNRFAIRIPTLRISPTSKPVGCVAFWKHAHPRNLDSEPA